MEIQHQYTPYAQCDICTIQYSTDDFKLLSPCGHFLCTSCADNIFRDKDGTCPFCRTFVMKDSLKHIMLQFVPPNVALTERVIDGLQRMDENTKLVSVMKTPKKLTQAAEGLDVDTQLANSLLHAIAEFKERIAPMFKDVKKQKEEIQRLQSELDKRKSDGKELGESNLKIRHLEDRMRETRKTREQAELDRDRALVIAQKATDELDAVQNANTELNERVSTLEKEIDTLKGHLQQHKEAERKNKAKRKEMQRRLADLESKASETNEASASIDNASGSGYIDLDENESTITRRASRSRKEIDAIAYHVDTQRDFEGMPGPGFSSDWTVDEMRVLKKPKLVRKNVKEITNFPVQLDRSGRPAAPVLLGPRKKRRILDPLG